MKTTVQRLAAEDPTLFETEPPKAAEPAPAPKVKQPTFDQARGALLAYLAQQGWSVQSGLKIPHATSPDGTLRLWFKAQAVYFTDLNTKDEYAPATRHEFKNARTVSYSLDIRKLSPEQFVTWISKVFKLAEKTAKARTQRKTCAGCGRRVPANHQKPPFEGHKKDCSLVKKWNSKLPPKEVKAGSDYEIPVKNRTADLWWTWEGSHHIYPASAKAQAEEHCQAWLAGEPDAEGPTYDPVDDFDPQFRGLPGYRGSKKARLLTQSDLIKYSGPKTREEVMEGVLDALSEWDDAEVDEHLQGLKERIKAAGDSEDVTEADIELGCWMEALNDYLKSAKVNFDSVIHKAAEARDRFRDAYLSLHSFKAGLDGMEEIPSYLHPIYDQLMKVLGLLSPAQQEAEQLTQMTNRMLKSVRR